MSDGFAFAHDINVRNSWVPLVEEKDRQRIQLIERSARFELYRDIDSRIKSVYIDILKSANAELEIVHIKGLGPTRRSKNQLNLDQALADAALVVIKELFGGWQLESNV